MSEQTLFSVIKNAFRELREDMVPSRAFPITMIGIVAGLMQLLFASSFATLIFQHSLPDHIPHMIRIMFLAGGVSTILVSLLSSYPATVSVMQDSPAAILGIMISNMAVGMVSFSITEIYFTALAAIAVTSLVTGVLLLFLGHFKLGNLIRFVPYPVVGGFLAGTGWLMFIGGLGTVLNQTLTVTLLGDLFSEGLFLRWFLPLLAALFILVVQRRFNHPLLIPGVLLLVMIVFYAFFWLSGMTNEQAIAQGYLMQIGQEKIAYTPLTFANFSMIEWRFIGENLGGLAIVVATSVISTMLAVTGIEVAVRRPMDMNQDLQAAGWANIVGGFGSNLISYQTSALSILGKQVGYESRFIGILVGLIQILTFFVGMSLLKFIPVIVIGITLIYFGLVFLYEWVWAGWGKLSHIDYVLVMTILATIAAIGFLEGVVVGIVLAIIIFTISYSQVNVIWYHAGGSRLRSSLVRALRYQELLDDYGDQLHVYKLRGFLFFGTVGALLENIRARLKDAQAPDLKFIVFDFQQVSQLDSSAINGIKLISYLAETNDIQLAFCHLTPQQAALLTQGEIFPAAFTKQFASFDHGIEWCEDQIIALAGRGGTVLRVPLKKLLLEACPDFTDLDTIIGYMERKEYQPGDRLIKQGSAPEALYIVESGQVSVHLEGEDDAVRLRAMGAGTVVGEVQTYLAAEASASVSISKPSVVYRLSLASLEKMEAEHPELATQFHRYIVRVVSKRLLINTQILEGLL